MPRDSEKSQTRFLSGPWPAPLLALLFFANSLGNGFAYDDNAIVNGNPRIQSLIHFSDIWLSDWWKPYGDKALEPFQKRDRLYRPMAVFSFALNYAMHELRPAGYHAVNVLLHAVVCLLLWHFAQRLFADRTLSTCAAVLFAVHPVHCEAVANVIGRAEVLAGLFLLVGLLALMPHADAAGWKRGVLAAAAFLAALLSKETAVCYLGVALLALVFKHKRDGQTTRRWWLMHFALLVLPLLVYFPLRYVALDHHILRDSPPSYLTNPLVGAEPGPRKYLPFTIVGHYTRLLLLPEKLSADYGLAIIDPRGGPELLTALGAAAAVAVGIALCGFFSASSTRRRLAVLAAMSVASYALISNTVLLIGVSLAERLLYWPSVPLLLLLTAAVLAMWRRVRSAGQAQHRTARLLQIGGAAALVVLGARTYLRNADWKDDLTLFETDVRTYPNCVVHNGIYATELVSLAYDTKNPQARRAFLLRADEHLKTALALHPPNAEALTLRGEVYARLGDVPRALSFLDAAVRFDPNNPIPQRLRLELLGDTADAAARLAELETAISRVPNDVALRIEIAVLLRGRGRYRESVAHLEHALRVDPQDIAAQRLYGQSLASYDEFARAAEIFRAVLAREPNDWETHANLAAVLSTQDPAGALRHARRAHELNPNVLATKQNLAEALALNGFIDEAIALYRFVERNLPTDDPNRHSATQRIRQLERERR